MLDHLIIVNYFSQYIKMILLAKESEIYSKNFYRIGLSRQCHITFLLITTNNGDYYVKTFPRQGPNDIGDAWGCR